MKIFKDILNVLKIGSVYVIHKDILFMCIPLEINGNNWIVSCDHDKLSGEVILKVSFNGSFIYLKTKIIKKEQDDFSSFIYELQINENEKTKDNFKYLFFMMISEVEEQANEWNKRKEERYEIGLDEKKIEAIGFKSPEQIVVTDKTQLPCVINNISFSGAKITTMEGHFFKDKKICLYLSFRNPIEQIPLISVIRNCYIKNTSENKNVTIISMEHEEPSYEYKKRIDNYIKYLQGGKND